MNCPRCRVVGLHIGRTETMEVRVCGRCGGVWLEPPDADKLLSWVKVEPWREPVHVDCVECRQPMQGRYLPEANVVVDVCPGHGAWFDHQELERLAGVVAHKRGRPAPVLPKPAGAGPALAAVVAASAVGAFVIASADGAPPQSSDGMRHAADVAVEGLIIAPEIAVVGADLGSDAVIEGGGAAVEVVTVVVEGGAEAAGGIVSGVLEALSGLLS